MRFHGISGQPATPGRDSTRCGRPEVSCHAPRISRYPASLADFGGLIERLRCDVCAVRPCDGPPFEEESPEIFRILQGFEDRPPQPGAEVYRLFRVVAEDSMYPVAAAIFCSENYGDLDHGASGSTALMGYCYLDLHGGVCDLISQAPRQITPFDNIDFEGQIALFEVGPQFG